MMRLFLKWLLKAVQKNAELRKEFLSTLVSVLDLRDNQFHPLTFINGAPQIGKNVYIGFFSEINAKGSTIFIGDECDIASFVSINVTDSHERCLGKTKEIMRKPIVLEQNVFVGSHVFIGGGTRIGHHSVVGSGTILIHGGDIPPYSLIIGNPAQVFPGRYKKDTTV